MLTPEQAWAIGVLEGEGSPFLRKFRGQRSNYRASVHVALTMTDRDVVERVRLALGGGAKVRAHCSRKQRNHGWTPTWDLAWNGAQAERIMRLWLPLAGERRAAKIRKCLATPNLSHHPRKKAA